MAAEAGDNSDLEVDYDELQKIIDELAGKQKSVSEATGSLRSALAAVIEQQGWHKQALAMIRKIDGMSLTARNDFLRTFEPMFDAMIEKKWRDEQQDLFDDNTEREE